ncbi:hypothetical protein NDU88_005250 [Pleurodeles waltl]|uniref:Uncharacterized protein n=1 Tax=Pleurodeles waltl TaxID=8319 RepID=A0AAV7L276_PLEWA|nr:hypothetical protein NDU88_005250 [Pleurodeles waltl]
MGYGRNRQEDGTGATRQEEKVLARWQRVVAKSTKTKPRREVARPPTNKHRGSFAKPATSPTLLTSSCGGPLRASDATPQRTPPTSGVQPVENPLGAGDCFAVDVTPHVKRNYKGQLEPVSPDQQLRGTT